MLAIVNEKNVIVDSPEYTISILSTGLRINDPSDEVIYTDTNLRIETVGETAQIGDTIS